jgi:hypothetical protein
MQKLPSARGSGEDPEASAVQPTATDPAPIAEAHFRKKPIVTLVTAEALAHMIPAGQNFLLNRRGGFLN